MKNIDSDLIRGNIDTIILKTMLDGDKYGLDIIKEVETRSNGTYELKQPTLYSCLKRLENQELISSYWLDSDIGGRRHYYKLTEKGHEFFAKKQEEWAKSKFIIDNLLSNYNYDEYMLVKKDDYDKIVDGKQNATENKTIEPEVESVQTDEHDLEENENLVEETINEDNIDIEESSIDETEEPPVEEDVSPSTFENEYETESTENFSLEESEEIQSDDESINDEIFENDNYIQVEDLDENETYSQDEDLDENYEYTNENSDVQEFDNFEPENNIDNVIIDNQPEDDEFSTRKYFVQIDDESEEQEQKTPAPEYNQPDQSQFEINILQRLRAQEDEDINTYVGDQKSYINHLNTNDDVEVIQPNLIDDFNSTSDDSISAQIDKFSNAVNQLNNFNYGGTDDDFEDEEFEEPADEEELDQSYEIETIDYEDVEPNSEYEDEENSYYEESYTEENYNENDYQEEIEDSFDEPSDDILDELKTLSDNSNNGFFNTYDNPDYETSTIKKIENLNVIEPEDNFDDIDYSTEDSSDASYEDDSFDSMFPSVNNYEDSSDYYSNETDNYEDESIENTSYNVDESYNLNQEETSYQNDNYSTFDNIISKNVTSYTDPIQTVDNSTSFFAPKYTSETYKQKLSNLSEYSKFSDETKKIEVNEMALTKAKDIDSLKADLEKEGIKVREHKKLNSTEMAEKTYLLVNKLNLVKSLILLFGFTFILSALYIILNNTAFKNTYDFSLKYFLFGIIPFGIFALYNLIMYLISPYKKTPAKFAPRIMIFISIIITIQLLLITYCINLQLGFYSFTQAHYNHLLWLIPTIISFAPIVSTLTHISLFYSKNFNI